VDAIRLRIITVKSNASSLIVRLPKLKDHYYHVLVIVTSYLYQCIRLGLLDTIVVMISMNRTTFPN
jgi:hypothetical protein